MAYIALLVISIIFALPTYGLSVLLFFVLIGFLNKIAAKPIIYAIYESYGSGQAVNLPYRDRATIRKAFKMLNVENYEEEHYPANDLRTFSGSVHHPQHKNPLFVQIHFANETGKEKTIAVSSEDLRESKSYKDAMAMINEIDREIKDRNLKKIAEKP